MSSYDKYRRGNLEFPLISYLKKLGLSTIFYTFLFSFHLSYLFSLPGNSEHEIFLKRGVHGSLKHIRANNSIAMFITGIDKGCVISRQKFEINWGYQCIVYQQRCRTFQKVGKNVLPDLPVCIYIRHCNFRSRHQIKMPILRQR